LPTNEVARAAGSRSRLGRGRRVPFHEGRGEPGEVANTMGPLDPAESAALDTPYLVVDLDLADARIASMASVMNERGMSLRPHTKTHKSIAFARRQIDAGAVGLTVA